MKNCVFKRFPPLPAIAVALAALMMCSFQSARAVTAEDFQFGILKVNGQPISGTIPLLVIVYELSTNGSPRQSLATNLTASMDQLMFNFFSFPSVNGYFLENSSGAFSWQRADVLGPLKLDASETATLFLQQSDDDENGINEGALESRAGYWYLLGWVAAKTGYNFAQWDSNGDGSITQDELSIVVIGNISRPLQNDTSRSGANRPIGGGGLRWAVPGQNVTVTGKVASFDHRASLMTIAHELSHSLGTIDIYNGPNCFNAGLTVINCTIFPVDDDRRTYHLDPWHKMRLGWLRPRIFTLGNRGTATVAASQIISANTPVILYDPTKGANEYFMVEFRNNRLPGGVDHDLNLTDLSEATPFTGAASGMAVWHVNLNLPANYAYHEGAPTNQMGGSALWNQMTPMLRWSDGTPTFTRLNPVAIINGGREMVFEWLSPGETWVDFQHIGTETGTFVQPFNTLAEGANAVPGGGIVKFKRSGRTAETMSISKPLVLQALGGPVTIGQ